MSAPRIALVVLFFPRPPGADELLPSGLRTPLLCTGYASCSRQGLLARGATRPHKGTSYWNMYTGTKLHELRRVPARHDQRACPTSAPSPASGTPATGAPRWRRSPTLRPVVGSVAWWGRTGQPRRVCREGRVVDRGLGVGVQLERRLRLAQESRSPGRAGPTGSSTSRTSVCSRTPRRPTPAAPPPSASVADTLRSASGTVDGQQVRLPVEPPTARTSPARRPNPYTDGRRRGAGTSRSTVTASRQRLPGLGGTASSAAAEVDPGTQSNPGHAVGRPGRGARLTKPLTASPGAWAPTPSSFSYQWTVDGAAVGGATSATFVPSGRPTPGFAVKVSVTGSRWRATPPARSTSPAVTVYAGRP